MSKISFACSNCGADIKVDEKSAGNPVECPECNQAVLAPPPGIEPALVFGDFKLIKCLGMGGMGEVWLAHQLTMDRDVALKILSPALTDNQKFVNRFMQEVKNSAKLQHPNIVTAFYAGVDKGVYYLAISYVDGVGLNKILNKKKRLPEQEALEICLKVAEALKYAWKKYKLVHRDIKPGNIMIAKDDDEVHLMDMGISKSISEDNSLTITGMILGTPFYMSPEQARGDEDLDCRADIYALGATLYHLVTGKIPYDAPNTMGILAKLITDPFPKPQDKNPNITDGCALLLETMMAKNPVDRQQNWEQVIKDMKKVLAGKDPVTKVTVTPGGISEADIPTMYIPDKSKIKPDQAAQKDGTSALCPSCGVSNKIDALFCISCGKSLSRKCPECDEDISINMNFCSKCGIDVQTFLNLEDILEKLKPAKKAENWLEISKLTENLPSKDQVAGKKGSKLLSEINKIKEVASKHIGVEDAYDKADKAAREKEAAGDNISAMIVLQDFLSANPKTDYTPEIIHRINELKKVSYQGPEFGQAWTIDDASLELIPIPAGEFEMGSQSGGLFGMGGEKGRRKNEGPQHKVIISSPFWIGKYPVTIAEYLYFLNSPENYGELTWPPESCTKEQAGISKGCWSDVENPMVEISWLEATNFCKWLTAREIRYNRIPDGYIFRLPTEAEWEYCCRAGTTTSFHFGDSDSKLKEYGWFEKNSRNHTHPVGQKKPNDWGLYDMHGNVWEWCQDKYGDYTASEMTDPFGSSSGVGFVRRGGSWVNDSDHCRSAYRNFWEAKCAFKYLGFRLALAPTRIRMQGTPI